MKYSVASFILVVLVIPASSTAGAQSSIDPMARVVELRASCAMPGGTTLDNCFETVADLTDWLWGGAAGSRASAPNSLDQVVVHVGPGEFAQLECTGAMNGWVNFLGAGRTLTRFVVDTPGVCDPAIEVVDCTGLSFQDLAAEGLGKGATWEGTGSSIWQNVDLTADDRGVTACVPVTAWYDFNGGPAGTNGSHWFWNMRFTARASLDQVGAIAFGTIAGENWIYGSDILLDYRGSVGGLLAAVYVNHIGSVRVFGSSVRAKASAQAVHVPLGTYDALVALSAGNSALHMHGGIVNVDASVNQTGINIANIHVYHTGFVHTPDTAFTVLGSAGGTTWRIKKDGPGAVIQSPFFWPPSTTPPDMLSVNGADMFMKTNAGPAGDQVRPFIYDDGCASNWRDATDATCL